MDKPQIITHVEKSVNYSLYDTKWIPCSAKFVTLGSRPNGSGVVQVFELEKNGLELISSNENSKAFKCGTFGASKFQDRLLATGDFEGRLDVWDLENFANPVYSAKDHSEIINCIDGVAGLGIGDGSPEIVTGSRDGSVKVWDIRQNSKPVVNIVPEEGTEKRDCWAVAFGNSYNMDERCVASGYDNGDLKIFDLRAMKVLWETNIKSGICSVEFDRKNIEMNKLVVTSLEAKLHAFDLRTHHQSEGFSSVSEKAHKSTIWVARHLPQNRDIFITSGGNGGLCLWKYNYPAKRSTDHSDGTRIGVAGTLTRLQGAIFSSQPITSFEWNNDKMGLAVCTGFDQIIRVVIVTKLKQF